MANQELAKKVLDHILAYPEGHDQNTWGTRDECGTTMCIAGWTCELEGRTPWIGFVAKPGAFEAMGATASRARELLGLSPDEAEQLFHCYDNDEALRRLKHFADTGEVEVPDYEED